MGPTTVLVVDDHEVLAQSLAMMLDAEPDLCVVGLASSLASARAQVKARRPDVVLLDVTLGDGDGVADIPRLLEAHPDTRIVVLTARSDDRVLLAAVEAGAAGFLSKAGGVPQVVQAVRAAAAEEAVMSPDVLARLLPLMRGRTERSAEQLTDRELEVLQLVARGLTNAAIAEELVLSVHTVRNHVAALSHKLGAHSKLEALSIGLRQGLVKGA